MGLQGLKPCAICGLFVAAEAATHKTSPAAPGDINKAS
jgi:hypothetical protein